MTVFELESMLMAMEQDVALYEERNFEARVEAIDRLEYEMIGGSGDSAGDGLAGEFGGNGRTGDGLAGGDLAAGGLAADERVLLPALRARAEFLRGKFEEIDEMLFRRLRAEVRVAAASGSLQSFRQTVLDFCDVGVGEEIGYDTLDIFVNRWLGSQWMPKQTIEMGPEMVCFQKTPARIVFELVEKAGFTDEDIFFDLGSGLGQVAMLVHLLAGVEGVGIEIEPAFVEYARERALELGLSRVSFVTTDARQADYTQGTVFFLYTPFRGGLLQEVLRVLRREALDRPIRVIAYGPCIADLTLQDWLEPVDANEDVDPYRLKIFRSNLGAAGKQPG
ncbi:MAG TPA: class I SAM-dependent methyltransferase [Puia sp.]|nr:class I SAM-dependent methyltransferase [Puia sp.]